MFTVSSLRASSVQASVVVFTLLCAHVSPVHGQETATVVTRTSKELRGNIKEWHEPEFPAIARFANAGGPVLVELMIDELGNVVSARIVSGHPLLQAAVLKAARTWKFNPVTVRERAVRVKGYLSYTFPTSDAVARVKSLGDWEKEVRVNPKSAEARYELGSAYFEASRYGEAISELNVAIIIDPKYSDAHVKLGHAYARTFLFDKAEAAYKEAIKLEPERSEPWHALGQVYMGLRRYEDAIVVLDKSLKVEGPITFSYFLLGKCHFLLNRSSEAVRFYQEGLAKYPDSDSGHFGLGEVFIDLEQYGEAIKELKEAIRLGKGRDWSNAHYLLGLAYVRSGDRKSARREYEILKPLSEELARQLLLEINKPAKTLGGLTEEISRSEGLTVR